MKPAYAYLTDDDREYVIATKKHLAQLMQRHGVSVDDLSFETGIPPRLADTVIDQLMVMADALAPPSSSGHPAVTTRATRHNCKKSCAHNVHYVQS